MLITHIPENSYIFISMYSYTIIYCNKRILFDINTITYLFIITMIQYLSFIVNIFKGFITINSIILLEKIVFRNMCYKIFILFNILKIVLKQYTFFLSKITSFIIIAAMDGGQLATFRRTVCVLPKSGYYIHTLSDFGNTLLYEGLWPQRIT
jgi:hypothetical protein